MRNKNVVLLVLLILAGFSVQQLAAAPEKILILGNTLTANNSGRYQGAFWGLSQTSQYNQGLITLMQTLFTTATITYRDMATTTGFASGALNNIEVDTAAKVAYLNSFNLIILSRSVGSGDVTNNVAPPNRSQIWNQQVVQPLVCMSQFITGANANRWAWYSHTATPADHAVGTPTVTLKALVTTDTAFANITLSSDTFQLYQTGPYTPVSHWFNGNTVDTGLTSFSMRNFAVIPTMVGNNATVLAEFTGFIPGNLVIARWNAGTPFYTGSAFTPAGTRILLAINDDRNTIFPPGVGLPGGNNRSYDLLPYLTADGMQFIHDLLDAITVPVELSEFSVD